MVGLIDDHDFEFLLGRLIDLLCLCDLLQQILDNYPVMGANVRRCDFEVVDGCDDVELEFAVAACLEDSSVDLDLLHSRSIELFQRCYDSSFLSGARGTINEEMRKITTLSLSRRLAVLKMESFACDALQGTEVCLRALGDM